MGNSPDNPFFNLERKLEQIPKPGEAANLLFEFFGRFSEPLPIALKSLMREGFILPSIEGNPKYQVIPGEGWFLTNRRPTAITSRPASDTPLITTLNVGGADKIITATLVHHWMETGPDHDMVFTYTNQEGKGFWYKKPLDQYRNAPFKQLETWEKAIRLLMYKPKFIWDGSARLEQWEKVGYTGYYELQAGFSCFDISMFELLSKLSGFNKQALQSGS